MQLVLELLKKIFVALHGNASSIATNTTNIATNTDDLLMQQKINAAMGVAAAKYAEDQTKYSWTSTSSPHLNNTSEPIVDFNVSGIGQNSINKEFSAPLIIPNVKNLTNAFNANKGLRNVTLRLKGSFTAQNMFAYSSVESVDVCAESCSNLTSAFHTASNVKRIRIILDSCSFPAMTYFLYASRSIEELIVSMSATTTVTFGGSGDSSTKLRRLVLVGGCPVATRFRPSDLITLYRNRVLTHICISETSSDVGVLELPLATDCSLAFQNFEAYNQPVSVPSLHTGDDMFLNSGMSSANIIAVLDSLPSNPVGAGGTGIITFTGCPGASELTQESESVAAATAKGWTVEL